MIFSNNNTSETETKIPKTLAILTLIQFHFPGLVDEHQIGHLLEPVLIQDRILK